ncbi:MAG: hypothetical protein AAFQ89_22480 [Cyanobacteria bacterium J06626_18]
MPEIPISSKAALLQALQTEFPTVEPLSIDSIDAYNEGNDLIKSKKYYKAKQIFKTLIVSAPDDFYGYEGLAKVYKAQGKTTEALFMINEALSLAQPQVAGGSVDIEVVEEFQTIKQSLETQ